MVPDTSADLANESFMSSQRCLIAQLTRGLACFLPQILCIFPCVVVVQSMAHFKGTENTVGRFNLEATFLKLCTFRCDLGMILEKVLFQKWSAVAVGDTAFAL